MWLYYKYTIWSCDIVWLYYEYTVFAHVTSCDYYEYTECNHVTSRDYYEYTICSCDIMWLLWVHCICSCDIMWLYYEYTVFAHVTSCDCTMSNCICSCDIMWLLDYTVFAHVTVLEVHYLLMSRDCTIRLYLLMWQHTISHDMHALCGIMSSTLFCSEAYRLCASYKQRYILLCALLIRFLPPPFLPRLTCSVAACISPSSWST